ncbi:MAG: hypothetical protein PVJ98_05310 [Akkermansiaceae bacterium]
MRRFLAISFLLTLLASAQQNVSSTLEGRVTFTGGNQPLRIAMVQDADKMIKQLDELAGQLAGKAFPIYVQLYPAVEGKPSAMKRTFFVSEQGESKYRLQIDLRLGAGGSFDRREFERKLLEMVVIERALRSLPPEETADKVEVRPWLVDGLLEAIVWRKGRGDRRMYASLMESGGWIEVEQLVDRVSTAELDVLSRELFRASSGALVMALLSQSQGQASLGVFLGKVAVFEGEQLTLLRTHFPQVNLGRSGLERWWMLQVAAMSEKKLTEAMTIPETEERLGKILQLNLKDTNGRPMQVGLDSWRLVADLKTKEERIEAARHTADLLAHLSFRSFPTYRPVIGGYIRILSDLAEGKTKDLDERMTNLETYRNAEMERHTKLVDLLDWYHLANVKEESSEFEDYFRVRDNLRKSSYKRTDPMNQYLDRVQQAFGAVTPSGRN